MTKETAMKILKELHGNSLFSNRIALETLIPELADSNDERIRKCLIDFFEDWHENKSHCWGIAVTAILAWLEKQGESYTKNDVDDAYLKGISDAKNELEKQGSSSVKWQKNTPDNKPPLNHSVLMKTTHGVAEGYYVGSLWFQFRWSSNIKDSDVLAWMELSDLDEQSEQKNADKSATTKQEGWIEIPFGAKDSELQEETYYIPKGFHAEINNDKVVIKKGEKSAAWSEEDENYLQSAENACEYQYGKNTSTILWLKSLKDRVQPKQEWSKEDEKMLGSIIEDVDYIGEFPDYPTKLDCELKDESNAKIKWLKSLKNRIGG